MQRPFFLRGDSKDYCPTQRDGMHDWVGGTSRLSRPMLPFSNGPFGPRAISKICSCVPEGFAFCSGRKIAGKPSDLRASSGRQDQGQVLATAREFESDKGPLAIQCTNRRSQATPEVWFRIIQVTCTP